MNAVDFLRAQRNNNNNKNNEMERINKEHKPLKLKKQPSILEALRPTVRNVKQSTIYDNTTERNHFNKIITLDDVIYGFPHKHKKNEVLHRINPIDGTEKVKRKVNKNNMKILKAYLKQQAELINNEE